MNLPPVVQHESELIQNAKLRSRLRTALVRWFAEHARDLPWRRDPTPYKVWVSEIMCQQTQIANVIPYFERFIKRYPDEASLAASDEDELMRLWEGLGYYRRARSLRTAAQKIVELHDARFPLTYDDVIALPGIGRYTAGAILSISQNQALPILEGNTIRVFSRWIAMQTPVDEKTSQNQLWQFSQSLLPTGKSALACRDRGPAAVNQAAMELGALICTPREPKCLVCPVAKFCDANTMGLQSIIPGKVTKTQYEARNEFAAVVRGPNGRLLVRQIPAGARFAGMWDFPKAGPPEAENAAQFTQWLEHQLGGTIELGAVVQTIKHAVTKYRITLHAHVAAWTRDATDLPDNYQFVTAAQLTKLPMSTTGRKLLDRL
ncbi:A/G-specific adenine glycosylase [Neorhodopirellula pilleata]|uniref:Adenine DNA glycosylase n=1 Tax=Neorhodopirellula pilleata TaxID=2714738 RepID=A0A5C5ZLA1_9BACT|nr:A/G-specific adenine glycosylase [Neorhodopirellula pilleata]TWT87906.1 A/G-specific adenine glycosylase [Neorhodopirellula pilleata]